YLAKAGLKVLVLERRPIVGGACVTEEILPGFRVSTLAYTCGLLRPEIKQDLRLSSFGLEEHVYDPSRFLPFPDRRYLLYRLDPRDRRHHGGHSGAGDLLRLGPPYARGHQRGEGCLGLGPRWDGSDLRGNRSGRSFLWGRNPNRRRGRACCDS